MTGRHPRAMRPRDESAHPVIEDALAKGHLDTGAVYAVNGFQTHEAANQGRLSINRAGKHLNVSTAAWVVDSDGEACYRDCEAPDSPHGVRFRLHSKNSARHHIVQQTQGDPSKLRYNPWQRGKGPYVNDDGGPLDAA